MSERDAFGPNLRRLRVQRGVTLDQIAAATKVSADLWAGLERNDFSRWPAGIYARAYLRSYAAAIGVDPEGTVDDFCRWFPQGDRRAERVVREQAALVGHDLSWKDELHKVAEDRRSGESSNADRSALAFTQTGRLVAAVSDLAAVTGAAAALQTLTQVGWAASLAICAVVYHAVALVTLGCTPAAWAIETYLTHRHPTSGRASADRFVRLLRRSDSQV